MPASGFLVMQGKRVTAILQHTSVSKHKAPRYLLC